MRYFLLLIIVSGLTISIAARAWANGLKSDETVQFQDGYAIAQNDGSAKVRLQAWVFEREPRRGALGLFARYVDIDLDEIDAATRTRFERTARPRRALFRCCGISKFGIVGPGP